MRDHEGAGDRDEGFGDREVEIPFGSPVVKQSQWAWIWSLIPWIILAIIQIYVAPSEVIILTFALALITTGPRYLRWKRSAYILTDEHIIIQRGTMSKYLRYVMPISRITEMRLRPGYFGNTLGYRTVELMLGEHGRVLLDSVPAKSPLVEHIRQRLQPPGGEELGG